MIIVYGIYFVVLYTESHAVLYNAIPSCVCNIFLKIKY